MTKFILKSGVEVELSAEEIAVIGKYNVEPEFYPSMPVFVKWLKDKRLHSYDGLPAYRTLDGNHQIWAKDGATHRESGPAEVKNGAGIGYWLNDLFYTKEKWENAIKKIPLNLKDGWYRLPDANGNKIGVRKLAGSFSTAYHWVCVKNGEIAELNAWYDGNTVPTYEPSKDSTYLKKFEDESGLSVKYLLRKYYVEGPFAETPKPAQAAAAPQPSPMVLNGVEVSESEYQVANKYGVLPKSSNDLVFWEKNGKLHSYDGLPAKRNKLGSQSLPNEEWYDNGLLHKFGGAAISSYGLYIYGIHLTKDTYNAYISSVGGDTSRIRLHDGCGFSCHDIEGRFHNENPLLPAIQTSNLIAYYKHGMLHNLNGPAVYDKKRGKKYYYIDNVKYSYKDWKIKVAQLVPPTVVKHDFGDGLGKVDAHRHPNGRGWVAETAKVDPNAFVGASCSVFGTAEVLGGARITNGSKISGNSTIGTDASVKASSIQGSFVGKKCYVFSSTLRRKAEVHNGSVINSFIDEITVKNAKVDSATCFGSLGENFVIDRDIFGTTGFNKLKEMLATPKKIVPAVLPKLEPLPVPKLIPLEPALISADPIKVGRVSLDEKYNPTNKTVFGMVLAGALLGGLVGRKKVAGPTKKSFVQTKAVVNKEEEVSHSIRR